VLKHLVVPGLGALMNVAELAGIVYLAITAGGASSKDAYKALGLVALWIVLGVVWVAANPNKDHARKVHEDRTSRTPPSPAAV
jgi:hypothetical protein